MDVSAVLSWLHASGVEASCRRINDSRITEQREERKKN
jgi:hypothetical protein